MMTWVIMVKRQLELNVVLSPESGKNPRRPSTRYREQLRRQSLSQWWFARMRQAVEEADKPIK
jgi:hypothetical protein